MLLNLHEKLKKFIESPRILEKIDLLESDVKEFFILILDLNIEATQRNMRYLDKLQHITIFHVLMCLSFILILWIK